MTWDEAVDMFPDLWVVFKDCKMYGIDIEEGILVDVIADQDIKNYMKQHFDENIFIGSFYFFYCKENQQWEMQCDYY